MRLLSQHIEALVFTSEAALSTDEIISCLKAVYGWELTKDDIRNSVAQLKEKYKDDDYSFELCEIAGGFQFLSKKEYHSAIHVMLQLKEKKRLSTAALETLAIIAYKQPITKPELEHIRGVSCDYSIQKLLEKDLIVIAGKSDGPGKPLLYGTSKNFMDHFGISSVKDLPKLKDIQPTDGNEIGFPSELMDAPPTDDIPPSHVHVMADDETEGSVNEDFEASSEGDEDQTEKG